MKHQIYRINITNWEKYNRNLKRGHKSILVSTGFLSDAKIRGLTPTTKLLYLSCLLVAGESTQSQIDVTHDSLVYQSGVKSGSLQSQLDQLESLQLLTYEKVPPNRIEKNRKEEKGREYKARPKAPPPSDPFFREKFNPKILPKAGEIWNSNCSPLTKITMTSRMWNERSERILADYGEETFTHAVTLVASNSFLAGGNKRKWKATFAWLLNPENLSKVLNGDYGSESSVSAMISELEKELAS